MLHAEVCAYELPGGFKIERCKQIDGGIKWACRYMTSCLNKSGDLEKEPLPSNRDKAFLENCRFNSPREAYDVWLPFAQKATLLDGSKISCSGLPESRLTHTIHSHLPESEDNEPFEFEAFCAFCGGSIKYKITPEQKWFKELKKSVQTGEELNFIDFCGYCCKEQTMATKLDCIRKALARAKEKDER